MSHPFATIAHAISEIQAGDVLYLRGGTYEEVRINLAAKSAGTESTPYTILSYPGEWAIVDGGSDSTDASERSVFYCTSAVLKWWTFRRMEITGGGGTPDFDGNWYGCAVHAIAQYCTFTHLSIHDNNMSQHNPGASGGLIFDHDSGLGASRHNLVEYCYFIGNGNLTGDVNTANAHISFYSDYLYENEVDPDKALAYNEVSHCLFVADADGGWTPCGLCQKGFQRLTGYDHGENEDAGDATPHDASCRSYGDSIHHNLFIGHAIGIRADQDYVQVYNNVLDLDLHTASRDAYRGISTADVATDRRGAAYPCVYNNTVLDNDAVGAVKLHIKKNNWNGLVDGLDCDYSMAFAPGNLLVGARRDYVTCGLAVCSGEGDSNTTKPQPHSLADFVFSRNFFYASAAQEAGIGADDYFLFESSNGMTIAEIVSGGAADVAWAASSPSPFVGGTGTDKYKTTGSYALDGTYTIANGGLSGTHPYRSGVTIPSYVGAVDPGSSAWIDEVYGLSTVTNLY